MPIPTPHTTAPAPSRTEAWTELAHRSGDGLDVTLLWSQARGRVKVAVLDRRLGEAFDIRIPPADALRAYTHPYAYARRCAGPEAGYPSGS